MLNTFLTTVVKPFSQQFETCIVVKYPTVVAICNLQECVTSPPYACGVQCALDVKTQAHQIFFSPTSVCLSLHLRGEGGYETCCK